jgi:hypothetical protein
MHLVRIWPKADILTVFRDVRFRGNSGHIVMSALPLKADITECCWNVRFGPVTDISWALHAVQMAPTLCAEDRYGERLV